MSTSPEYDTIDLPANQTIAITQPLEITHTVTIVGNDATLFFQQGNTAAWPADASGAIYVNAPAYTNIQLTLENFTIRFDMSAPIRWSNPAGTQPALWDPENNPAGITNAVIDTRDSNTNLNRDILTLTGMTIYGPPAFDGSSYSSLQAQLVQSGDTSHEYVGEQDIDLIRANDADSGTITQQHVPGRIDRGLRWSLDHHGQHGPGLNGRYLFAGGLRPPRLRTRSSSRTIRCRSPIPPAGSSAWSSSPIAATATRSRTIPSGAARARSVTR